MLNLLSIGREENYFYHHVLFNVRSAFGELSNFNDTFDFASNSRPLHEAGKQAASAQDKLAGARGMNKLMLRIREMFESDFDYITALAILERNHYPFSEQFVRTLSILETITSLLSLLVNIGLCHKTGSGKYWKQAQKCASVLKNCYQCNMPQSIEMLRSKQVVEELWKVGFTELRNRMVDLPREEPILATKIVHDDRRRARNIATNYCYKHELSNVTLLYIDFTGLRTIPEPKEQIIGLYYRLVEKAQHRSSGIKLYGGRDGDDAYTLLFEIPRHAALCAIDIKREWQQELFLSSTACDVKFGIAYCALPATEKETPILQCWGEAKDMCEFKGPGFRNRGNLLMEEKLFLRWQLHHTQLHYRIFLRWTESPQPWEESCIIIPELSLLPPCQRIADRLIPVSACIMVCTNCCWADLIHMQKTH